MVKRLIKFLNDDWKRKIGGDKELETELIAYMLLAAIAVFLFAMFSIRL